MRNKILALLLTCSVFTSTVSQAAFPVNSQVVTTETQAPATTINFQNVAAANAETPAPVVRGGYSRNNSKSGGGTGMAIASLACGVAGLFILGIPLGILAIVFGAIALGRSSALKGLAIAGLIVGILDVVLVLAYLATV